MRIKRLYLKQGDQQVVILLLTAAKWPRYCRKDCSPFCRSLSASI